jgi:glyoxylase-like metal-dependent hydrolase (beta-lactamase superfamily II)
MPLPFALDHINLWLIQEDDGWVLIDAGIPDQRSRDLWLSVFDGPMAGKPVTRLLVTHFHPDHMGLAAWFEERFGIPMEATRAEWLYGRTLSLDTTGTMVDASHRFYHAAGFGEEMLSLVAERRNAYSARVKQVPVSCRRLCAGDRLTLGGREWRVLIGEGHSPELACFWCAELRLLISGDQILPSISPNVSVWSSEPDADPLRLFLQSLDAFRALPADSLVLPSHGRPFYGLRERIDQLIRHHRERLEETYDACYQPISAHEMQAIMFPRRLDQHQQFFAIGESLAHLHYLLADGRLVREADAKGVNRFRQA